MTPAGAALLAVGLASAMPAAEKPTARSSAGPAIASRTPSKPTEERRIPKDAAMTATPKETERARGLRASTQLPEDRDGAHRQDRGRKH
jgi:hypothetical protein